MRLPTLRRFNNEQWLLLLCGYNDQIMKRFACPFCVAHYDELNALRIHFYADHKGFLPDRRHGPGYIISSSSSTTSYSNETNASSSNNATSTELFSTADQDNFLGTSVSYSGDSQDQDFSEVGNKRTHDESLLLDTISIEPSPLSEHLLTSDFDVSDAFYKMQLSLKEYKWKLSLEDHLHAILASGSILLLSPHRYPDKLKPFIHRDNWLATIQLIKNRYKINRLPMPVNTVANILAVIDKLTSGTIVAALFKSGQNFWPPLNRTYP
ncbi:hypothetical protein G6F46_011280 [Rhizopus delemar]|nr:hypothetical protein G6F36_014330 [Rhizopus arrhizus]KAG1450735.1 hypothetical protein G6F55_009543 [Rhizopus delemar]KAG1496395.1 hypothetical protein G6F52_012943 [Rhizopus delemar]KAG1543497.1 hypothetical protein G6F51_006631 [Rhizopus arrhizus]KAG1561468.1 hypothetical protein G6F50_012199 [Rhizopus delemar]